MKKVSTSGKDKTIMVLVEA